MQMIMTEDTGRNLTRCRVRYGTDYVVSDDADYKSQNNNHLQVTEDRKLQLKQI